MISEGHTLEGFQLAHCNLAGIHLLLAGQNRGVCLRDADLYRANLQGAHMFRADLRGGSLMKADCREANLNFSDLRDTNLLGTRIEGARIDNIQWGRQLRQQRQGEAAKKARQADMPLNRRRKYAAGCAKSANSRDCSNSPDASFMKKC